MAMSKEFNFLVVDANQAVEPQQTVVRQLVGEHIQLNQFKRNGIPIFQHTQPASKLWKQEGPYE